MEIADQLTGGDFSQRELLQNRSLKERDYQVWLAGNLALLSRGYYTVSREEEVIENKKPDIRLHSSEAGAKVSIEVKVADSWSGNELRDALVSQLVSKYQRDPACRHGILVLVSLGKRQSWTLDGRRFMDLEQLRLALCKINDKKIKSSVPGLKASVLTLVVAERRGRAGKRNNWRR
jgi:hypothetical protein